MEFVMDNFIWFLVGGIVLLMTLIGYLAEKTDFGHRETKSNDNVKKKKEKIQQTEEPNTDIQVSLAVDPESDTSDSEVEKLNIDLDETPKETAESPVENIEVNNDEINVDLPDLESINSDDTDDVWKF